MRRATVSDVMTSERPLDATRVIRAACAVDLKENGPAVDVSDRAGIRRVHWLAIMLAVIALAADWLSALPAAS